MKKIIYTGATILTTALVLAEPSLAADPGVYLGAGLGYEQLSNIKIAKNTGNGGVGGRVFAGYNFNNYFGLEAGFAAYQKNKYKLKQDILDQKVSFNYRLNSTTLVAKGYLPLSIVQDDNQFNLYGLLGVSYSHVKQTQKVNTSVANVKLNNKGNGAFVPVGGVGANYAIDNNLTAGVEYTITGSKSSKNKAAIPNANLVSLNLIYRI